MFNSSIVPIHREKAIEVVEIGETKTELGSGNVDNRIVRASSA